MDPRTRQQTRFRDAVRLVPREIAALVVEVAATAKAHRAADMPRILRQSPTVTHGRHAFGDAFADERGLAFRLSVSRRHWLYHRFQCLDFAGNGARNSVIESPSL